MELSVVLLTLLVLTIVAEWLIVKAAVWKYRRAVALISLPLLSFLCTGLLLATPNIWTFGIALAGAYRAINLARIIENRMQPAYARRTVLQTADWLGSVQLVMASGLLLVPEPRIYWSNGLAAVAAVQLLLAVLLCWSTLRQLHKTRIAHQAAPQNDSKLPSITVAIPARNEDQQLEACLESILASDYPKLEILVLDDCSQDKTSDIVRAYAHAGVRFIKGVPPPDGWLPKNFAYSQLLAQASGSLVLFCGVDIRLQRNSIRILEHMMQRRNKLMVSVLPVNDQVRHVSPVQAMRYFWEMVPPRRLFSRPPVLSSCWLVRRSALEAAGGFAGLKHSVTPEALIARQVAQDDGYSFVRSDNYLGIVSRKPLTEQVAAAVHMRYPQLHRRPEMVLAVAGLETLLLLGPLAVAVYGLWTANWLVAVLAVSAAAVHHYYFGRLQSAIFPGARGQFASFLPAVVHDLVLLHYSLYKYEFSEVYWRGRNVCYPVMHVIPRLPKPLKQRH